MTNNEKVELIKHYKKSAIERLRQIHLNSSHLPERGGLVVKYNLQQAIINVMKYKASQQGVILQGKRVFSIIQEYSLKNLQFGIPDDIIRCAHIFDRWALDYSNSIETDTDEVVLIGWFTDIVRWLTNDNIAIFDKPTLVNKDKLNSDNKYRSVLMYKYRSYKNIDLLEVLAIAYNLDSSVVMHDIFCKEDDSELTVRYKETLK